MDNLANQRRSEIHQILESPIGIGTPVTKNPRRARYNGYTASLGS